MEIPSYCLRDLKVFYRYMSTYQEHFPETVITRMSAAPPYTSSYAFNIFFA